MAPSIPPSLQAIDCNEGEALEAALQRDGACIALNLLAPALCDVLSGDFAPHLAAIHAGADDLGYREAFYGQHTKRLHGLFSKSPQMAGVLTHPVLMSLVDKQLVQSGIANSVRLSNAELMVLEPGQTQQAFHRDAASWPRAQQQDPQDFLLSANIALTAFTIDNGATCVVPGSHRWPADRQPAAHEVTQAVMPRGSALLYLGNAVHAGGANRSAAARTGLYLGYVASWLRPLENQLVTNQVADVLALPPQARTLLDVSEGGFTVYA